MTSLNPERLDQFRRAVGASNPMGLHPLDERRFTEFFLACAEDGVRLNGRMIDEIWPADTQAGLGGDPAHSERVKDQVYELLDEWLQSNSGRA